MTPKTAARKAQKKAKRLKYRCCSKCGGRCFCKVINGLPTKTCRECKYVDVRSLGGGIGKRIHGATGDSGTL